MLQSRENHWYIVLLKQKSTIIDRLNNLDIKISYNTHKIKNLTKGG